MANAKTHATSSLRLLLTAIALVGAALACTFSSGGRERKATPSPSPVPLSTLNFGLTPSPTLSLFTSTPTLTGGALPNASQIPATAVNCFPNPFNWQYEYIVAAGDTLGTIAQRAGTTLATLQSANCIANPDLIYAGQALVVPGLVATLVPATQPAQPTAPPAATQAPSGPAFSRALTVDPHWFANGQAVTANSTVRVNAGQAPNAAYVEFYVTTPGSTVAQSLGRDGDPYDGAFIDYQVSTPGQYSFYAIAFSESGQTTSNVFVLRYDPAFNPPGGQRNLLTITPSQATGGTVLLTPGATVTITWADAPLSAIRVDFVLTPTGTGTSGSGNVIASDNNPANGTSVTWTVPSGLSGHVQASALMPGGSASQTSELLLIATSY